MSQRRIKFLRYMNSNRLIYRFEWDLIAVPVVSGMAYFVVLTILQVPLWFAPFFAFVGAWKTLNVYRAWIKDAAPGYLYHFFYSISLINPVEKKKKNGKTIYENPINIPYGFENDFRD